MFLLQFLKKRIVFKFILTSQFFDYRKSEKVYDIVEISSKTRIIYDGDL